MDFVCKNRQQCLFHSMVCDGIIQCRDGSDEDANYAGCCKCGVCSRRAEERMQPEAWRGECIPQGTRKLPRLLRGGSDCNAPLINLRLPLSELLPSSSLLNFPQVLGLYTKPLTSLCATLQPRTLSSTGPATSSASSARTGCASAWCGNAMGWMTVAITLMKQTVVSSTSGSVSP